MRRTDCTEPQCLYKGAFYLFLFMKILANQKSRIVGIHFPATRNVDLSLRVTKCRKTSSYLIRCNICGDLENQYLK